MRTLYFDCGMGAAGDMLTAALVELFENPAAIIRELNTLGIPGVRFFSKASTKCGINGTHMQVLVWDTEEDEDLHDHGHHHSGLEQIDHIISHLRISDKVRRDVTAVYDLIAQAESHAHGVPVNQIHFHEVGTMDAIADITAVCYLLNKLQVEKICASAIHVGSGQVKCAHGLLPVPAPATARLLEGVPIYGGRIRGELCTPTGAALLKHFADSFGDMPTMAVRKIGYGMGAKDFEAANCLRAMLGETSEGAADVCALRCNLDDMTGEALGFAMQALLDAGALDAWCEAILMKKGRPGQMLCCLCRPGEERRFAELMLRHTATLGVRVQTLRRYALDREAVTLDTPWGPVRGKRAFGCGVDRIKPEFDDVARLARERGVSTEEILKQIGQ